MFALHPDRSLLNPKFDGYKLDPISSEDAVSRYALQHKASQASVSGRHHFSFQEAQSRIRHDHLSVSPGTEQAVYIDENLRVISIRLDHDTLRPSFGEIYDIPQPTQTPASDSRQREYPSSVFLDAHTLLCADGHGTLYVLTLSPSNPAELLGFYELPNSTTPAPFRLHTALSLDGQAIAVLSFRCFNEAPPAASSTRKIPPAEFDVVAVRIPLDAAADNTVARPLDILWHRRGTNVPLYLTYEQQRKVFLLAGGSPYRRIGQPAVAPDEPSPNEFVPTPSADGGPLSTEPTKPPPYAWTQDSEEVTVALPFPSSTPKGDISVLFSPQTLTVLVQGSDFPRYSAARLWGGISPSSSFWTWDAQGAHTYGVLTLHLEKQHAGTRWPHVFDASAEQIEVAETLDPSELYAIRESLEKYTAELQGAVGAGGGARPSLADGEADEEVDSTVGTDTCITWVYADGTDPAWAHEDWGVPFTVLSTPLPGSSSEISMVAKHTIDGPRFVLSNEDAPSGRPVWTHVSTYSALAFVLASKRDTRFTYHVPSKAVLAFEGGGGVYGGNLYLYRDAEPKNNSAKQVILRLAENTSGSLLGVGAVHVEGQTIILCLCEKELVVLRNAL
ncbi:hypothetical protein EDB92DRAFT_1813400 [Lactarius akahatsu]|uniref:NudC domain-containing protein 1 n=1 Tax=Lactarius akahatsu TaxID=416441 RepID=A0AAD4LS77_9AGAM|nr:hypothetical protein EDB92DRAFT_1813400 [Lactarius akahatsu]